MKKIVSRVSTGSSPEGGSVGFIFFRTSWYVIFNNTRYGRSPYSEEKCKITGLESVYWCDLTFPSTVYVR